MQQNPAETHHPEPLGASSDERTSPQLFTPREAARTLAISERTLWSLTRRGEVRSVRFGRSVRYDAADLRALVEKAKAQVGR